MGGWDSSETCEVVGTFLLLKLAPLCQNNVGIYRDDALMITKGNSRSRDTLRKAIINIFKNEGLNITIEHGIASVNFLDVTLDLTTHSYKPYTKPNSNILYVHKQSNHPPNILNNIPVAINKRLNKLSSNEDHFNAAAPQYQAALQESGYSYRLYYDPESPQPSKKRNRNKQVIWFNPPYSKNVATSIGKKFLQIVDSCFDATNPLRKIFNRHTVKVSYSCMPNFHKTIKAHNNKILNHGNNDNSRDCNCHRNRVCPLEGKCLSKNIVYQATVVRTDNNHKETYIGSTGTTFKLRYGNHTQSFNNRNLRNSTKLSKYIWNLKDEEIDYTLSWKIIKKTYAYNGGTKKCNLCLYEKYAILCKPDLGSLNSRSETMNFCRHRKEHLLRYYKNT